MFIYSYMVMNLQFKNLFVETSFIVSFQSCGKNPEIITYQIWLKYKGLMMLHIFQFWHSSHKFYKENSKNLIIVLFFFWRSQRVTFVFTKTKQKWRGILMLVFETLFVTYPKWMAFKWKLNFRSNNGKSI